VKHKPEIVYYPYIGEKLNDEPFDLSKGEYSWTQKLKILADKNSIEIHTPDKASYRNVIGVIFFDNLFYHNLDDLVSLHKKSLLRKTIYIDYEPPTGHAKKHEPESMSELSRLFKSVVTYDDDLAGKDNFIKGNVANFYAMPPKKLTAFDKRKMVCMITNATSNTQIINVLNSWNYSNFYNSKNIKYHPKAIYHKRQQIADFFLTNYPDDLDLYGTGWSDEFSKILKGFVNRGDKINKLSGYKFAITFDSYINQRGYISEKIFDVFFARTIPIYMGANNVKEYIPEACFIDMRDFKSYNELYAYLVKMTPEEYNFRLQAISRFLKSDTFNIYFSSGAIAKTLFNAVKAPSRKNYNYEEASGILAKLIEEKDKIKNQAGVISVDKVQKGKEWGFLFYITTGLYDLKSLSDSIFIKANGKFSVLEAKLAHFCDEGKYDTLNVTIFYEDIVRNKKIGLYHKVNGRYIKIPFFTKEVIEGTHYDNATRFLVKNNVVYIPGKFHKKLRDVYSR